MSDGYSDVAAPLVLVVDDEALLAEETAFGLEMAGIPAITASSAADALRELRGHAGIRVLVTDVRMPQEDGIALARRALAELGPSRLGVIFMTGNANDAAVTDLAGVVGLVRKPFAMEELLDLVRAALGGARRAAG